MAIVFPSAAIARRWDGALQARLRRAPLEGFLRARAIELAPPGVSQDSDNVARATVVMVEAGIAQYCRHRAEELAEAQRAIVGHVACVISREFAELISQPGAWRISALVSTARLLSPWIGLNAAALASASAVRRHPREFGKEASAIDVRIGQTAARALTGDAAAVADLSASIAVRMCFPMPLSVGSLMIDLQKIQAGA